MSADLHVVVSPAVSEECTCGSVPETECQLMCTWLFCRQKLEEWACGSVPDKESAADLHVVVFFNYAGSVFLIQTFAG
jgi:hypothetical protein